MSRHLFALAAWALMAGPLAAQPPAAGPANLGRLHDALKLTPDQEPAWRAYSAALAPNSTSEARHHQAEQLMPLLPTPRRIALLEATMAADQADFHRRGQAVTRFYDQLSAAQKQVFDQDTLPPVSENGARPDS